MDCLETMEKIGLYIMIFSILALYLSALPDSLLPLTLRCALLGAVEITTGIQAISGSVPGFAGALLITAAGAFGGISGDLSDKKCTKKCRTVYPALYSVEIFPQRSLPARPLLCASS